MDDSIMDDSVFDDEGSSDFVPEPAPVCNLLILASCFGLSELMIITEAQGQGSPQEGSF